jgi:3-phenylpropionate/trans-cinnamate dioxygenase ferredoxin reductase subunit
VIVGASLAGAKAAQTLRDSGFDGSVLLVGDDVERPYERPPLSKKYLAGEADRDAVYVHDADWYDSHDVELRLGTRAVDLDVAGHEVGFDDGQRVKYDKLLLATGSSPRRLALPGAEADGVYYLRTVADSDRLRAALRGGGRQVVVVGAGWIGLEVAAVASGLGHHVTIVEQAPTPLYAVLGSDLGEYFAQVHRAHDVDVRLSTGIQELHGAGGHVISVLTDSGETLAADIVVVGVGIQPNVELAEAAGLRVANGVVVDAGLRSSDEDVYAAGDVANGYSPLLDRHLRVEHWSNALHGGPAAALSMLGEHVTYDRVPFFFTDQYDLGMEYSGFAGPSDYDRLVYRGDKASGEFIAFWTSEGQVLAGMNVNVWDVAEPIQALIRSKQSVDIEQLCDPSVPLGELLTEQQRS